MLRKEFPAVLRRLILLKDWAVAGHDLIAAILTGTDNSGILSIDCSYSISEILIFPGPVFMSKIFVEPLAADTKHPAIE